VTVINESVREVCEMPFAAAKRGDGAQLKNLQSEYAIRHRMDRIT